MNGTIIDIPGISVRINPISLEDSTDKAHVITIKDQNGKEIEIQIVFGKITKTSCKE